ncbi:hypothetical protein Tco_1191531 [Tanacetum coccineum]
MNSNTYVLERVDTSAGNPVKEILLKLNLPDHRKLKGWSGVVKEFQRSFRHSDTEHLSRSDEVLKLNNFKKDASLKLSSYQIKKGAQDHIVTYKSKRKDQVSSLKVNEQLRIEARKRSNLLHKKDSKDHDKKASTIMIRSKEIEYCENEDHSFTNLETEYPAIVFDDTSDTSDATLSCEPTYTDTDIADFEVRLTRIYRREVYRVHVFDFRRLSDLIAERLSTRMLVEHRDAQGQRMDVGVGQRLLYDGLVLEIICLGRKQGALVSGEEASMAPGGGDEDEEMPIPSLGGCRPSLGRRVERFTTWMVTSLARLMDRADVPYTRYSESPIEYQRRTRIKPGSKFSTIVREYDNGTKHAIQIKSRIEKRE